MQRNDFSCRRLLALAPLIALCAGMLPEGRAAPPDAPAIVVNAQPLSGEERRLLRRLGVQAWPGRYWYDRVLGAWGLERGPTAGFIAPGLNLGGALRADASGGGTGVFINGRELHPLDVAAIAQVVQVIRGRWWVNAQGYFGPEGGPLWGNLWWLARQQRSAGGTGVASRDGRQVLRFDESGRGPFQGSNLVGGPTTW